MVYDRFQGAKHFNDAIDKVRRCERRAMLKEDGDSPLTGTRGLWPYNPINLTQTQQESFAQVVARNLKAART